MKDLVNNVFVAKVSIHSVKKDAIGVCVGHRVHRSGVIKWELLMASGETIEVTEREASLVFKKVGLMTRRGSTREETLLMLEKQLFKKT